MLATLASKLRETEWIGHDRAKHGDKNMTGNERLAIAHREALRPRRQGGATPRRTYRFHSRSRENGRPCPPRPQSLEAQRPTEPTGSRQNTWKMGGPAPPALVAGGATPHRTNGFSTQSLEEHENVWPKPGMSMKMSGPPVWRGRRDRAETDIGSKNENDTRHT